MTCKNCNIEFNKTGKNHIFCSIKCKLAYYRAGVNYCQICYSPLNYENRNKLKARKYCDKCSYEVMRQKANERRRLKKLNLY
jgi:hypothetical protein